MQRHSTLAHVVAIAFSYIRFSTREQIKGDSLRRQTKAAQEWCDRNGVRLDASTTYHDLGKSAYLGEHRKNPDRYALAAFLKLAENGKIPKGSYLIVENLDRLTREHVRAAVTLFLSILELGINIVSTTPERIFRHDSNDMTDIIIAVMELSRGHGESERKSQLVGGAWAHKKACARAGKPQPPRKENRVNGMALVTHCLPSWIEERGGKPVLIPERAAVVKRIYHLAANGYGQKAIAKTFIREEVPPIGTANHWNSSYIGAILRDRRAVGEFQPKRKHGREKDGEAIADYFPAVVTEEEWLAATAGRSQRRKFRGRTNISRDEATGLPPFINVFQGLLKNALGGDTYQCVLRLQKGGRGGKNVYARALMNTATLEGRGECRSFPFSTFEAAVLSALKEIDPHEILNGDDAPDESLVLAGQLAAVEVRIGELEAELLKGDVAALARVLRHLEDQKRGLAARLAVAREKAAHPLSETWGEAKTLLGALDAAPDPQEAGLRLRTALRRIVKEIWILVVPRGTDRLAAVQIWFAGGERHRDYLIFHRPDRSNGKATKKGYWQAHSLAMVAKPGELDLRNPEHAQQLEATLTAANLPRLE
jgi:DNA invertase Pin-like site-specific DNA recombinase